jgi:hypothetical protein
MPRRLRQGVAALHPARRSPRRHRHEQLAHSHDAPSRRDAAGHLRRPPPLLTTSGDRKPGQILGQNVREFGGLWLVVRANGTPVR